MYAVCMYVCTTRNHRAMLDDLDPLACVPPTSARAPGAAEKLALARQCKRSVRKAARANSADSVNSGESGSAASNVIDVSWQDDMAGSYRGS